MYIKRSPGITVQPANWLNDVKLSSGLRWTASHLKWELRHSSAKVEAVIEDEHGRTE